jgi:glycosyltransferase involved in cell wall biosynthesis
VDVDHFRPVASPTRGYYLVLSALVPYKRVDLAVAAAPYLRFPLKVVGTGPEARRLKEAARGNVELVGELGRTEVHHLLANARALLFPGEEDFGITPVEAAACGTPVVAYARGGALETVVDGRTGLFFEKPDEADLTAAIHRLEDIRWNVAAMRAHAELFAPGRFLNEMREKLTVILAEG